MPHLSDVFADVRGEDRTMRISLHPGRAGRRETVVVSLWLGPLCRGSFRMAPGDLDRMMATLAEMRSTSPAMPGVADSAEPAGGPAGTAQGAAGMACGSAAPVDGAATARGAAAGVPAEATGVIIDAGQWPSTPAGRVA